MSTLLFFITPLIGIAMAAIWVYCIQDALRSHRPWTWVLIVLFFPVVSAPLYILNFKTTGRAEEGRIDKVVKNSAKLAELKKELEERDVPGVRRQIAEIYFERENYVEALKNLGPVIEHNPEDIRSQFQAGVSLLNIGREGQALDHLEYVLDNDPKYQYGAPRTAYGDVLAKVGMKDEAAEQYRLTLRDFNHPEAAVKFATLLRDRNEQEEARQLLRDTLQRVQDVPREFLPGQRPWIKRAAELLRQLDNQESKSK